MSRIGQVISELIGRANTTWNRLRINQRPMRATRDYTRTDYAFWDAARRCDGRVEGLEIAGLLLKPVTSKIRGWALGQMPRYKVDPRQLEEAINHWFGEHKAEIGQAMQEALDLGDYFIVVNADLTLSLITPDVVEPIVDEDDYSKIIGWRIIERFDHPTEPGRYMIEINEYTATERVRTVEMDHRPSPGPAPQSGEGRRTPPPVPPRTRRGETIGGSGRVVETYPNLLGIVPVIHVPNNVRSNELFGSPELAAVATSSRGLLHTYGEVLDAGVDGNMHQGRSTPVANFDTTAGMNAFFEQYGGVKTAPETGQKTVTVDWHSDRFTAMVGGKFSWESPSAFIGETEKLLGILYWIMLEHAEVPEFAMGTAVSSSKASTETQLPIFVEYITMKRNQMSGWLLQLAQAVGGLLALRNGWTVGEMSIVWDSMTDEDGRLTLDTLEWALEKGLITRETALLMAPIEVEDAGAEVKKAEKEREKRREEAEERFRVEPPDRESLPQPMPMLGDGGPSPSPSP